MNLHQMIIFGERRLDMIIKDYPLENEPLIINEDYLTEKRFARPTVLFTYIIQRINHLSSKVTLNTKIILNDKINDLQIIEAKFSKSVDLENSTLLNWIQDFVGVMTVDIYKLLLDKIPPQTVDITPPLISGHKIAEVAEYVFSELTKLS